VDVLLRLHQLEHLPEGPGALPSDLSGALVFDQTQLEALRARMQVGAGSGAWGWDRRVWQGVGEEDEAPG
jgi:hypothetical protein